MNTIPYSHGKAITPEMAVAGVLPLPLSDEDHPLSGRVPPCGSPAVGSKCSRVSLHRRSLADGESRSVNETSHAIVVPENRAPCLRFQNVLLTEPTF